MVPKGWNLSALGDVCLSANGLQTGPFGSQLHAHDYVEDGIPVVMPKDLINGQISVETIAQISLAKSGDVAKHKLKLGDIVFSRRGDLSKFAVVKPNNVGWICGTGCIRARLNSTVVADFVFCQLNTHGSVRWLESNAVGQTMPNLNTEILSQLPLRVPPLPEQRKIAAVLSTWDRAIELTEKLISAKQKRKQALMQQLLTGKVRLPGFSDAWVAVRMGDIFKRRSESGTSDLPTLSVTVDRGLIRRDSIDRKMETTLEAEEHLLVRKGDIAYNMMRMWQGASGLALEDGLVSPAYIVLKPTSKVDSLFASYFFKLRHTVKLFEFYSFGITGDRLRLYYKDFAAIPTTFPTIKEQKSIAAILSTADTEIEVHQAKLEQLQQQKKGLMQQLLTGKVRVSFTQGEAANVAT